MAGKARRSEHPPKRQKPSRLRNEVRPDSTDDERDRRNNIVQVPNSDTVVSGTQPDHDGDSYHEDPIPDNQSDISLSPNSAALLERTAVTKKTVTIEPIPFSVNLLSRNPIGMNDSSASAAPSPNPFAMSYSQTRREFSKPYSKEDATATESTHIGLRTLDTQQHEAHASQDLTAMAEPVHVPPHLPDNAHVDEPCFMSNQNMNVLDQTVTTRSREEPTHAPPMQANATSDVPPSAQLDMRPVSQAGRVPGVKKGKKRKRGQLSQQPEGPLTRSRVIPSFAHQAETTGVLAPDTSADPQRLSENNTGGDEKYAFHDAAFQAPAPVIYRHGRVHTTDPQLPDEEHGCTADDNESYNPTQSLMDTTSQDFQDSSAQRQFPTSSVQVQPTLPEQPDMAGPMQQPLANFHDQAGSIGPDKWVALSTRISGHCTLPNSHGLVEVPAVPTQPQQPKSHLDSNFVAPQPVTIETHLHNNLSRDGPPLMTKSRRKLRPSGPISHGLQGQTISPSIEDAMENFRVAILANKYRVQHETKTITQQHDAEIAELQQTINHQTQSIAEHEERYRKLEETLTELTNAAKRNQRSVTGLQQDHENLQKIAKSFQNKCGRTLTEKITELEDEKRVLQQEVGIMTDKLATTQRKMRSTLEDVWTRLLLSESKREDLAENVGKLEAALNDERKNRDIFSKQLLSGVHNIPRQVVDSFNALTEKIKLLTGSLENADARDSRHGQIKESLDALQDLRQAPAVTVQDIEKMSSTLRLVHERLDSGLDTLSETVTGKVLPDAELQKFIKEQVHGLQTEMLKHEEVAAESRKTHELNIRLESQLEAQQKHCNQLEEKIKDYANSEVDLKALCEQLKRDLSVLRDTPRIDTSGLEQEVLDLRQKLQKAEEDLAVVNTRIEKMESERDTYKSRYEDVNIKLREFEQKPTVEQATAAREQIAQDCQREFEEKERNFKREIDQLTVHRDEKEKTLQELNDKLDAADTQLDELNEKVQTLESKLVETINLQKQLESMTEELHNKEGDFAELNRRFQAKTEEMLGLQDLCSNLQTQLARQQTAMQTIRQDADSKLTKVRQEASDTLQLSSDQVSNLQMEKKDLSTRLEQVKMNEVKLQHEAAELSAVKEAEITRVKAEADEENQKLVEQHRIEVDDWKHRMSQKDAAFQEMEAKFRLAEDQYKTKIASDREKAESNMRELEQKYRDALRVAHEQSNLTQQVGFQVQTAKSRKKVSRQNQSMLEAPEKEDPHSQKSCSGFHAEAPQTQLEDEDLFATQFGGQSEINDIFNGKIDVHYETGTATENQDIQCLPTTQNTSNGRLLRTPQQQLKRQVSSSSDLSSISTDELTTMGKPQPVSSGMLGGSDRGRSIPRNASFKFSQTLDETQLVPFAVSQSYSRGPSNRGIALTDHESVAGSQSSRSSGRPQSQANTSSRLVPPPSITSGYLRPSIEGHAVDLGASTQHTLYSKADPKLSGSKSRSSKLSSSKQLHNQHGSQHESRRSALLESQHGSSQDVKHDHAEKRKSSTGQTERDSATKKQRTKSQSWPLNSSPDLPHQPPYVATTLPKAQKTIPYAHGGATSSSQPKTPVPSSRPRARISRQAPSSGNAYFPRGQSTSQTAASGPTSRSSTRLTRSKSRNGTAFGDHFTERFNQELNQQR